VVRFIAGTARHAPIFLFAKVDRLTGQRFNIKRNSVNESGKFGMCTICVRDPQYACTSVRVREVCARLFRKIHRSRELDTMVKGL
jgi:hypothetical protein